MAKIVEMTQLSPTMSEGVLAKWRKNEGDKVGPGDVLAEVETDKANMELEAFDKGVLLAKLAPEGAPVKVGAPIGIIGSPGEDVSALVAKAKASAGAAAPAPAAAPTPAPANGKTSAAPAPVPAAPAPQTAMAAAPAASGSFTASGSFKAPAAPQRASGERVLASPLARAVAAEKGVDVAALAGSGPHGRIVLKDVESAAAASQAAPRPAAAAVSHGVPAGPEFEDVSVSPMRRTIAQRLTDAKRAPDFYLTVECDAAPLKAFRAQANEGAADADKVSLNDVIVKCVARALRQVPLANASWVEQGGQATVRRWKRVHVGIAVALEDGLITPVVRDADVKPLSALAAEAKDLIARARVKKLKAEEYSGATISVSNLGMMGIEEFTAILNPPGSTILAVGGVVAKPVVSPDGKSIVPGERIRLTLTCDHRVVDGALGATLLGKIKELVEHPIRAVL